MSGSIKQYEADIAALEERGRQLLISMIVSCHPDSDVAMKLTDAEREELPQFTIKYQGWYSEALALVKQLIPERATDFQAYYAPKTHAKELDISNYTITDYLRGVVMRRSDGTETLSVAAGLTPMSQQLSMIDGLKNRFKSTLYDIRTLVHADLLDDELHAAEELNKSGFQRGAGAVAGVVLEGHLGSVCERHQITLRKKEPTVADLNEALKAAAVIDVVQWRFVQHLGDIRNKCDHKKQSDPTKDEVSELIEGVRKITKTVL